MVASNSLITGLESWIAAASGQESRLCHLLVRHTAPQLSVSGRMKTPASYLEASLASLKGFQYSFHVPDFARSHHQILLQLIELI